MPTKGALNQGYIVFFMGTHLLECIYIINKIYVIIPFLPHTCYYFSYVYNAWRITLFNFTMCIIHEESTHVSNSTNNTGVYLCHIGDVLELLRTTWNCMNINFFSSDLKTNNQGQGTILSRISFSQTCISITSIKIHSFNVL